MNVLIDFNVTSLASAAEPAAEKPPAPVQPGPGGRGCPDAGKARGSTAKASNGNAEKERKVYTGPRISLDVQDADIKAVFRLLAEQGKVSIVSGDDVKGTVTLHMKDVPWDQALDTILDIKGLDKRVEGQVITVITLDRKKKDDSGPHGRRGGDAQVRG